MNFTLTDVFSEDFDSPELLLVKKNEFKFNGFFKNT